VPLCYQLAAISLTQFGRGVPFVIDRDAEGAPLRQHSHELSIPARRVLSNIAH
jgi:hypothetical protein